MPGWVTVFGRVNHFGAGPSIYIYSASPGIHLIAPGPLQLNVIRHHRHLVPALTSRSKCHRTPYHWRAAQGPLSLRSCSSFIGSRSANESSSSMPYWFARSVAAVSRMTVSCLPPDAVNSDRLTLRLVLSCGLTRLSAIVVSLWLDRVSPRTWNSLPIKLRQPDLSLEQFRRLLKTHLFS